MLDPGGGREYLHGFERGFGRRLFDNFRSGQQKRRRYIRQRELMLVAPDGNLIVFGQAIEKPA